MKQAYEQAQPPCLHQFLNFLQRIIKC